MGIGLGVSAVKDITDENGMDTRFSQNKVDIEHHHSYDVNKLKAKLPAHMKEMVNRSINKLNDHRFTRLANLLLQCQRHICQGRLRYWIFQWVYST